MKKVRAAIAIATVYWIFYQLTPFLGVSPSAIYCLFGLSPFVMIAMVYIVLKFGTPSKYTFNERFYEDMDIGGDLGKT